MSGIVSSSFGLNLTVLKLIGLYPSKEHSVIHKIYATSLFVLSMTLPLLFGSLHFLFIENLDGINYNDYVLVSIIFYTFKLWPFLKKSGEIKRCVEYFDDYAVISPDHGLIIEKCVSTCKRNSLVFFGGCVLGFVGIIGQILLEGNMEKLPVNVWLPKSWKEARITHCCVYVLLTIGAVYVTAACGTIDPLIGGLSHHASAQLQILGHCLRFLDDNEEYISDKHDIHERIKMCIRQYQHVVTFVHKYQECFSPVMFSQLMSSVLVIGLCCFQFSTVSEMKVTVNFFVNILSLGLLFFQIFFYCYYGTLLMEENDSLFRAIYMSKWYEYDEPSKKALLVLTERLKKPLIVTAGKILVLSLETFTTILKRSYSLVAVLKNY